MRLCGRRYDLGQPVWIEVRDGMIADIQPWPGSASQTLPWIAPGLIDLQVNGYGGEDFTDRTLTVEAVERISRALDQDGVTAYLPTVITQSFELQRCVLGVIAHAIETLESVRQRVAGIHLEGPYISREDGPRGAHPLAYCRPPDWEEFQRLQAAAIGHIRLLTMSPEYPNSPEFIRRAVDGGVLVSIGHTNANSDQIRAAVDAGARLSTHLGNGTHARIHRHSNYVWDQLAEDRLTASLIADGYHLPPAVVKCFVRGKTAQRVLLVSDITGLAGTVGVEPGFYQSGLGSVEVLQDGRVVVAGQREYLAGATQPLHVGVTNVMRFAGVSLAEAIDMATTRPADLLQTTGGGRLVPGAPATLIQFHLPVQGRGMKIVSTILAGQCVYGEVVS
ncbi:MAG: N-acetylglucosamine-6-phosphate deacetylase [Pirellulaceae bacterium]